MLMYSPFHSTPLAHIAKSSLYDLPSPASLNRFWNFGSGLGMCLTIQISTGVLLAMHYSCETCMAFESISHIMRDVSGGWSLRSFHANGASMFFILIYLHLFRGLYYGSYGLTKSWLVGSLMLFVLMAAAFLGYVLPWGQMSFWGATVITNLLSAVPRVGPFVVEWVWGGFSIGNSTLTRFFTFHFIAPFILAGLVALHLANLHETGSSNPLGINSNMDKIPFHPYFSIMDLTGFIFFGMVLLSIAFFYPWELGDPENFNTANPLVTPLHIQPEWYFLFAYAILRSIPNKLGGVVALVSSVAVLFTLPFLLKPNSRSAKFSPRKKIIFWTLVVVVILLTWIGARPVEEPYIFTGQVLTCCYFGCFLLLG